MPHSHRLSIETVVHASFINEINALKPGNVSRYGAAHGMTYSDFVLSADLTTPVLCDRSLRPGKRVLESVRLTREALGCNTNLGMLLLFSPIIKSYETNSNTRYLQNSIKNTLTSLDRRDAEYIYAAIRLANPGGLGKVAEHDVKFSPNISLLDAMNLASDGDLVARQYVSAFAEVFEVGVSCLGEYDKRWNSVEWATVACYLSFMSCFPDSHVRRKFGESLASQVQERAVHLCERFKNKKNPATAKSELLEFDRELKDSNINPGTSADLTAASLLLYGLQGLD